MPADPCDNTKGVEPLRWRFQQDSQEFSIGEAPRVDSFENDRCAMKALVVHRPTHDPQRDKAGDYPFAWHLSGRRRLWEIRFQLRFKQLPERQVYFGIELDRYVPVSGVTRQVQKVLVSACRKIVGDCYHSPGDDPKRTEGEAETPAFMMPLWAFDQFEVSEAGKEPDLASDLEGRGMRRTEGVSQYISAVKATINNFSTDKVYTFCFWGVSQFLDCMQWEVTGGVLPGVRLDFNKLCGQPPIYMSMYELSGVNEQDARKWGADRRHLSSRKRYYLRVAVWSALRPPKAGPLPDPPADEEESPELLMGLAAAAGAEAAAPPGAQFEDLLGLCSEEVPVAPVKKEAPAVPQVETCDLLGLDFS